MNKEKIVCSAVKLKCGLTVPCVRHGCKHLISIMTFLDEHGIDSDWADGEESQGFITNSGKFVTRAEAYDIASACGQILDGGVLIEGSLFSENLY